MPKTSLMHPVKRSDISCAAFKRLAATITETARIMAPMAEATLDSIEKQLSDDLAPMAERLQSKRAKFTALRDARRTERRTREDEPTPRGDD